MAKMGRPAKEFDRGTFENLVGIGCTEAEICWWFRDQATGKPTTDKTLSGWCKRIYNQSFSEYIKSNGGQMLKVSLRRSQMKLSERSAAMAIFLGKQYLGQRDDAGVSIDDESLERVKQALGGVPSAIK